MKKQFLISLIILVANCLVVYGQGYNHQWLLGYEQFPYLSSRIKFDSTSYLFQTEYRKMGFQGTEATISDKVVTC